ncbi:MAG TPA: hypothetical protein VIK69_04240 [Methylophilaceae bacterium]
MVAFLNRMPYGIPGDVTRPSQAKIETQVFNPNAAFPAYGLFGKIDTGKFVPIGSGDSATDVYGILVRPYPTTGKNASDPLGTSVPLNQGAADVLRSGYVNVKVNAGVPTVGGAVYIRVADAAPGQPIGGIEAAPDSTDTILVAGATFMSGADANGNAEIAYNI